MKSRVSQEDELDVVQIQVHHYIDKFLPIRQAYMWGILHALDSLGVGNEVYTYARENRDYFPREEVVALSELDRFRRGFLKLKWRLQRKGAFVSQLCISSRSEANVIHHAHFFSVAASSYDIKRRGKTPFVMSLYGEDEIFRAASGVTDPGVTEHLRMIDSFADLVLVPSEFYGNVVRKVLPKKEVRLLRIGIDPSTYPVVRHEAKNRYVILCVARLSKRKGLPYLIETMPSVLRAFPNTQLVIVGEGNEMSALVRQAKQLGVLENMKFIPYQRSLSPFYSDADVFAMPSIVESDGVTEALGVSVIEAEASGLPVVASSVGGLREAVEDGKTGFLVPPADATKVADRLIGLLSDPEMRQKFGKNGIAKVSREFSVVTQAKLLRQFYHGLLRDNQGGLYDSPPTACESEDGDL